MTRITLISLILSSFYCQWVQAQNDGVEWAPIGATWYYSYSYHTSPQVDYIRMEATKDTLVNGRNARLIEGEIFAEDGSSKPANNRYDDGSYIIYQQGDSIYYLRNNKFELLYDFSMEVGDTMNIVTQDGHHPERGIDTLLHIRVESIGKIVINGDTLRKQVVSMNRDKYHSSFIFRGEIIEKIGAETFFLPYDALVCDIACPNPLRCYQDSSVFYQLSDLACDSTYVITNTQNLLPYPDILVYPNPVPLNTGQIYIEGPDLFTWRLRDLHGRMLYQSSLEPPVAIGRRRITATLPAGLMPGLYVVEIQADEHTWVRKLVVN